MMQIVTLVDFRMYQQTGEILPLTFPIVFGKTAKSPATKKSKHIL